MSITEDTLDRAQRKVAKVGGSLCYALIRRSVRAANVIYYVKELRQAADILEQLIPKKDPK